MRVFSTTEWRAVPARTNRLGRKWALGIVIHHTAGPNSVPGETLAQEISRAGGVAREIQYQHQKKQYWVDTGYHFIVSRGGVILEGRTGSLAAAWQGLVLHAAHAGSNKVNASWWGVVLEGTYTEVLPPEAQWEAAVDLCAHLSLWGLTRPEKIRGHRDFKATECPGQRLYDVLERFRAEVRAAKLRLLAR